MRIHIFGASGSGVTTLGKALSEKLHIEYFDSDDFFWLKTQHPFTQRQHPQVRNTMVSENVFPPFDLIIFLYLPSELRMERLRKRELERYGDAIVTHPEKSKKFQEFMDWAKDYDHNTGIANRTLKAHLEWLSDIDTPLIELSGDYELTQKMEIILNQVKQGNLQVK